MQDHADGVDLHFIKSRLIASDVADDKVSGLIVQMNVSPSCIIRAVLIH